MIVSLRRVAAVVMRHGYAILEPFEMMNLFYWQLFDIVIFGFLAHSMAPGSAQTRVVLVNIPLFYFSVRSSIGVSFSLFRDLIDSSFTSLMATPITSPQLLSAFYILGAFDSVISVTVTACAAHLFFGSSVLQLGFWLIPIIILFLWSGLIMGTLVLSFLLTFGKKASVIYAMTWLFVSVSGVFYPVDIMPYTCQLIARVIPMYHVTSAIRALIVYHTPCWQSLVLAALLNSVYFVGAIVMFNKTLARRKMIGLPRLESET